MKNEEIKEPVDRELYRLRKGFKALNLGYKKRVLKTAQGLLRIQRTHKEIIAEGAGDTAVSMMHKK